MNVRDLELGDLPGIASVIDATGLFPSALLESMTASYLSGPESYERWITCGSEAIAGVAYFAPEPMTDGTWNVLLIAVHPSHQGRGIGTELMRFIESELRGRGVRVLIVETSGLPEFAKTRAFYAGLGYDEEARIRSYYADGEDKIVFWKRLA